MTYFVDFVKKLTKQNNIGITIYLFLNTLLVVWIFSGGFSSASGILLGIIAYVISLAIALSPVGEWILRLQTGCKEIRRKEYIDRLEPLFSEVLTKARKINPNIPEDVKLFMSGAFWVVRVFAEKPAKEHPFALDTFVFCRIKWLINTFRQILREMPLKMETLIPFQL